MRVLWILNLMPPTIGEKLGKECSVKEGWISGILARAIEDTSDIVLGIACPVESKPEEMRRDITIGNKRISCFGFCEDSSRPEVYDELSLIKRFREIYEDFTPDILHIFGTEYGHCLAAAKAFNRPKRILIGFQGIISECAVEYMADLPPEVYQRVSFRDWLKQDSMVRQQKKFALRGQRERQALLFCGNITGRTSFDRRMALEMNPHVRYFFMNETLRKEFSSGRWEQDNCIPHRIFFSQADYPLKGFHYLLAALKIVKKVYPDVSVAVAGNSLVNHETLKDKIKISAYGRYLRKFIDELDMQEKIFFLGKLSAQEMKEEYLKCHTYVCASALENSPNSVGEAMSLGVPVVASDTGGIPSMLKHEKEGLLFTKGDSTALAGALIRLWEDTGLCEKLGDGAREKAVRTYDGEKNYERLLEIYKEMISEKGWGEKRREE